ncbi:MAG: hypothetical protein GX345_03600 [Clostridiales bacterium]|nr:hypothetical protein [Clostridiales bacterium]
MKKSLIKILALLMVAAMVFSLGACGKDKGDQTTEDSSSSLAQDQSDPTEGESADQAGESTTSDDEDPDETDTTDETQGESETDDQGEPVTSGEVTTATPKDSMPSSTAEILKAYTDVMNKAKTDKPAYKKKEFQELPADKRDMDSGFIDNILGLARLFMTEEDKAGIEEREKGNDMRWFPVYKAQKGCLLTNTSAIKNAECIKTDKNGKANPSGDYHKITIVLKDEYNPEPYMSGATAPSYTGAMFSPLSRKEIDDTILNDNRVNKFVRNVKYDLRYYDCKAELIYNPKTNEIVKLDQYMSVFIKIEEGKFLASSLKGTAVLENTMKIWDFKY